jgi:hypothetical protein
MDHAIVKTTKQTLTHKEYIRLKTLGITGLAESSIDPIVRANRYLFVNDINQVKKQRLEEYIIWYLGDSDRLKNFFTRENAIGYNLDPLYNENKKSYFWAVSSTEHDIKRTHSGHPRNIVDTLTAIMSIPNITNDLDDSGTVDKNLHKILKVNNFKQQITQMSRPLTLVEGWGAWKINWDRKLSDYPILLYYRADRVDFIYQSNQLRAIIYKDFYQNVEGKNYVLYETRRLGDYTDPISKLTTTSLYIEKELYEITPSDQLIPCKLESVPQLKDITPQIVIQNFKHFLGYPNIFYHDVSEEFYGRSIFTGKTDIFDDLDQCFSQGANTVRRSTVHEYFNVLYLETDPVTGLPIQPDAFDRKYIKYNGAQGADGTAAGSTPVQVVQPQISFQQYSEEERNLLLQAISGIMSPATLGIDVAKKDNADAQREKEKVTIFTRKILLDEEQTVFEHICSDLLVAYELMNLKKGEQLSCKEYNINVQYAEFANESFEKKLETVQTGWAGGLISDGMALDLLYGDSISKEKREKELKFLQEQRQKQEMIPPTEDPAAQGGFGELGAENPYNDQMEKAQIDEAKADLGIPDLM